MDIYNPMLGIFWCYGTHRQACGFPTHNKIMTEILQDFIDSLPSEDTLGIDSSMKDRRVMSMLSERGITLPESVFSALEDDMADKLSHEAIMESMRPFMDMRLEDFPTIQQR